MPNKSAPAAARTNYEFRPDTSIEKSELDSDLASLIGAECPTIFERAGKPDPHRTIEGILDRYASAPPEAVSMVKQWSASTDPVKKNAGLLLEKIVKLYDSNDPQAALYFEKLGHNRAVIRGKQEIKPKNPAFAWPEPPEGVEGEYWDMATGLLDSFSQFTTGRVYRLFDASPYVSRQMATLGKINHLNYVVEQKDIRYLQRPERPIAALRIKNAATYAPGFQAEFVKMADWIAPKGQMFLQ